MIITIKDDDNRFGVRVGAIIFNKARTHIFVQRQKNHDFYMLPGGRLEIHENTLDAIKRELNEELSICDEKIELKYIIESFIKFPKQKYHEIGFYFITVIDEKKYDYDILKEYNSKDEINDGKSLFRWIKLEDLEKNSIMPNILKDKIINYDNSHNVEHLIYNEYE